jgi:hypothetical protein
MPTCAASMPAVKLQQECPWCRRPIAIVYVQGREVPQCFCPSPEARHRPASGRPRVIPNQARLPSEDRRRKHGGPKRGLPQEYLDFVKTLPRTDVMRYLDEERER